jgi:hypothetical protein
MKWDGAAFYETIDARSRNLEEFGKFVDFEKK